MGYRGSLKQCVAVAYSRLKRRGVTQTSIVNVPGGKYYTVEDDPEYATRLATPGAPDSRIIFHGTLKELEALVLNEQLRLFGGPPDVTT